MKKHMAELLLLAVTAFVPLMTATAHAAEPAEQKICHTRAGDMDIWIIAATWRDQPAEVLLPRNQEQKDAIARIYPEGKMRNALNVMLVHGKGYLALVDTGLPGTLPGLMEGLALAGVKAEDITHVIITHAHGDHIGGLVVDGKAVFPKARVLMSEVEHDFWLNPANEAATPPRAKPIFEQLPKALAPYAGRVDRISPETTMLPGLRMVAAYGHTPGHVGVLAHAGGDDALLFWGDLVHGMPVQMAYPDVATSYDIDPAASIAARKALLERAAMEKWRVTGVHVPGVTPWPAP